MTGQPEAGADIDPDALLEQIAVARDIEGPRDVLDLDGLVDALKRLEQLEAEQRADALMLDSAGPSSTGFDIQMHAGGPKTQETLIFIADSMRHALDEHKATNYLEMELRASDHRQYVMTLQRRGGAVTPHQARQAAERRAEAAEGTLAAVQERAAKSLCKPCREALSDSLDNATDTQ